MNVKEHNILHKIIQHQSTISGRKKIKIHTEYLYIYVVYQYTY